MKWREGGKKGGRGKREGEMPATALHVHVHVHAHHSQPRTEHLQNTELNMYMYMHTGDMYMYIRVRVHEERLVSIFRELRKTGSHPAQFMYMLGKNVFAQSMDCAAWRSMDCAAGRSMDCPHNLRTVQFTVCKVHICE